MDLIRQRLHGALHVSTVVLLCLLIGVAAATEAFAQRSMLAEVSSVDLHEVKTDGFMLDDDAVVQVEVSALTPKKGVHFTTAWIIDARTREVAWEHIQPESSRRREVVDSRYDVSLKAGPYEVYYAAFPVWQEHGWSEPKGIRDLITEVINGIFDRDGWNWDEWRESHDEVKDEIGITVHTDRRGHRMANRNALADEFLSKAFLTITSVGDDAFGVQGFVVKRPTRIEIYTMGEVVDDNRYDYSWIVDVRTRERVWSMKDWNTEHAGGAKKNRVAREVIELPEGRYAAYYVTDDSHSAEEWNASPPYDPDFWGLTLRVLDEADLRQVSSFEYENAKPENAIVAFRGLGDDVYKSQGFSLSRPMDLRIYALGEGRDGHMFDYGWILNAQTRERVWTMKYEDTDHAGGSSKNRMVDAVVRFEPGNYVVRYVTDDSHSAKDWNADRPHDYAAWGITVVPAEPSADRAAIGPYDDTAVTGALAEIIAVRDDASERANFILEEPSQVRIHAVGEGSSGRMYDYGWIENAETGQVVWEMTYRMCEHAGGAEKNRLVDTVIGLPAGRYVVRYETDGSHSFGDWNSAPPFDPERWGITVQRVQAG